MTEFKLFYISNSKKRKRLSIILNSLDGMEKRVRVNLKLIINEIKDINSFSCFNNNLKINRFEFFKDKDLKNYLFSCVIKFEKIK